MKNILEEYEETGNHKAKDFTQENYKESYCKHLKQLKQLEDQRPEWVREWREGLLKAALWVPRSEYTTTLANRFSRDLLGIEANNDPADSEISPQDIDEAIAMLNKNDLHNLRGFGGNYGH